MPYVITSPCLGSTDQSCVDVCPVDCIHEAAQMFVIDPEECIDCNACVQACPVDAIFAEDRVPPGQRAVVDINAAFTQGIAAVDAAVAAWQRAA